MRLFLDAGVVITLVEAAEPFAGTVRATLAAQRRAHPGATIAASELSRLECRVRPLRDGRLDLVAAHDGVFGASGLRVVPLSPAVIDLATLIRARSGLRTPDALQAACCLSLGPPVRLVTNDPAFRREAALDVLLV